MVATPPPPPSAKWKGKQRAEPQPEQKRDSSGDGKIIPLKYVGTVDYDAAYVLPLSIGSSSSPPTFDLQLDTGSSDLWVPSSQCSSSSCPGYSSSRSYDPSSSSSSQNPSVPFSMSYASGQVDGNVYLDTVTVQGGDDSDDDGYTLSKHAFASVQSIQSEPLQIFDGVLGLAFPANSAILQKGKLTTAEFATDDSGRATSFAAGLLAGGDDAPDHSFLSLTLERPGSARIPSLLGIGKHPDKGTVTLPDSRGGQNAQLGDTNTYYTQVLSSSTTFGGDQNLWWKLGVSSMSVWADGQEKAVDLVQEFSIGGDQPTGDGSVSAVLDTGSSWIVVNDKTAASLYGSLGDDAGVEQGDDGLYYVSCSLPLNISFTISGTSSPLTIPLHPLDLSYLPASTSSRRSSIASKLSFGGDGDKCPSLIQPSNSALQQSNAADMVLGVPFLRAVYTVLAYGKPDSVSSSSSSSKSGGAGGTIAKQDPMSGQDAWIGLQPLVDPSEALTEFHRVRIENGPLDLPPSVSSSSNAADSAAQHRKEVKVGFVVLGVVGGLVVLAMLLFGWRWWVARKRYGPNGDVKDVKFSELANSERAAESGEREKESQDGGLARKRSVFETAAYNVAGAVRRATTLRRSDTSSSTSSSRKKSKKTKKTKYGSSDPLKPLAERKESGSSMTEYQLKALAANPPSSTSASSTFSSQRSFTSPYPTTSSAASARPPLRGDPNRAMSEDDMRQLRVSQYLARKERDLANMENPLLGPITMPTTLGAHGRSLSGLSVGSSVRSSYLDSSSASSRPEHTRAGSSLSVGLNANGERMSAYSATGEFGERERFLRPLGERGRDGRGMGERTVSSGSDVPLLGQGGHD